MAKSTGTSTSSFGLGSRESHDSTIFYSSRLYDCFKLTEVKSQEENELPEVSTNKIICASSEHMIGIPDNSVHLMITSPPYNVSKDYDDNLTLDEYMGLLRRVFSETYRVLVNGGRVAINVANVGRKPYIPLSDYLSLLMRDIGFNQRGEIIWDKGASSGVSCAWGSYLSPSCPSLRDVHEYILVFSKGDMKRPKGNKESTIDKYEFIEYTKSIWKMSTTSARKVGHPAPFPVELPYRLIQLYSYKNDIILDPFMGSGQTAIASLYTGRRWLGFEVSQDYVDLAEKRIKESRQKMNDWDAILS